MERSSAIQPPTGKRTYTSALFTLFNESGKWPVNHPLDKDVEEYHKVLNEIVIPDCMNLAPDLKAYSERMKKLITYNNLSFGDCWNFSIELAFRMSAAAHQLTEENLTKVRILRAAMDIAFTMVTVIDDVTDNSVMRMGKKSWHRICSGGKNAAIYDGSVLGYLPFYLLKKHFNNDSGYTLMLEKFTEANLKTLVGQTLDVVNHGKSPNIVNYNQILNYKAKPFIGLQPVLGMIHAGILDETIIDQVGDIFQRLGALIQIWDDFREYFCSAEVAGNPLTDFQNGGTTWVSATALSDFTPEQAKIFKECYGNSDPVKVEIVKKLLDEIGMTRKYMDYMRKSYSSISQLIDSLADERLVKFCYSYMDWLIGDASEKCFTNE